MNTKPLSIIIFGGTGDLARNMLFPSLFDLHRHGELQESTTMYVYAHTDMTKESMHERLRDHLKGEQHVVENFLEHVEYVRGSFDVREDFKALSDVLDAHDGDVCSNKLFYLSAPPRFFDDIIGGLKEAGLNTHCDDGGWSRLVIEKPFGESLETSKVLKKQLRTAFNAEQVFHVDHYLCKDMVRNMTAFRFSNAMFEPLWNNQYIESIEVRMHEEKNVDTRGRFYDPVGAFRDVGQNHILEMLASTTMERPESTDALVMQQARAEVLSQLEIDNGKEMVKAQYEGYREIDGVGDDSETETYFKVHARINSTRWAGVPITLSSGKESGELDTRVRVVFKDTPCLCQNHEEGHTHKNVLNFIMKPEESIILELWSKEPGLSADIRSSSLSMPYDPDKQEIVRGAYSKVFFDAIVGDQTLFKSTEEIFASWKFTDQVLTKMREAPLQTYKRGLLPQ